MNPLASDILALLRTAGRFGVDGDTLLRDLRQLRHRALTLPELELALRTLADSSFVAPFSSPLSGKRWRLTALGESALTEEGL